MTQKDNGGSALPTQWEAADGMTLRDYFAGQALVSLVASEAKEALADIEEYAVVASIKDRIAMAAYDIADAMMEARK